MPFFPKQGHQRDRVAPLSLVWRQGELRISVLIAATRTLDQTWTGRSVLPRHAWAWFSLTMVHMEKGFQHTPFSQPETSSEPLSTPLQNYIHIPQCGANNNTLGYFRLERQHRGKAEATIYCNPDPNCGCKSLGSTELTVPIWSKVLVATTKMWYHVLALISCSLVCGGETFLILSLLQWRKQDAVRIQDLFLGKTPNLSSDVCYY